MSYNENGLEAQQQRTARLTELIRDNFAFLARHDLNPHACRVWLKAQTTEDRLLLENWIDRTDGLQRVLLNAPTKTTSNDKEL